MKAYIVGDGNAVGFKRTIKHVKHFIAGYRGEPFTGKEYAPDGVCITDTFADYLTGQNTRRRVDSDMTKLLDVEWLLANSTVYTVIDPDNIIKRPKVKRAPKPKVNIYADIPEVVCILAIEDNGPCDMGASAACPHCGAEGRYIIRFKCADGSVRGAMRGCFSKFKQHRFMPLMMDLMSKEIDYRKKQWNLPERDTRVMGLIEQFADGQATEQEVDHAIKERNRVNDYIKRKRGWR